MLTDALRHVSRRTLCLAAGAAALLATPALAHHGWSSYDSNTLVTIEGPILAADTGFPHAHIELQHEGERWDIVLAPPSRMTAAACPKGRWRKASSSGWKATRALRLSGSFGQSRSPSTTRRSSFADARRPRAGLGCRTGAVGPRRTDAFVGAPLSARQRTARHGDLRGRGTDRARRPAPSRVRAAFPAAPDGSAAVGDRRRRLVVAIITGIPLFAADAGPLATNPLMMAKLALLALGIANAVLFRVL